MYNYCEIPKIYNVAQVQDNQWLKNRSSWGQACEGVKQRWSNVHCMCVSVCVAHPTHQAGDFPLSGSCHENQVLPDKSRPRGPLPWLHFIFTAQNPSESGNIKRRREKIQQGERILSALCLSLHVEVIYWGLGYLKCKSLRPTTASNFI